MTKKSVTQTFATINPIGDCSLKLKRKLSKKLSSSTVSANRRKRMRANNKKKLLWRNRSYVTLAI
ncbi:hypothetical protein VEZ01S_01_01660 [Vibrio ezurae NBRC 102218]|uniref:Uncharacterized protein n=1 Tax=Vibrio ezurae NBRC 102218 TaxID=1219080 RepID=U3AYU2_9VIBR|nr:hypothetical protein VEZ01S_01_01660 [Vibrio ezurae NBRC 102218]